MNGVGKPSQFQITKHNLMMDKDLTIFKKVFNDRTSLS